VCEYDSRFVYVLGMVEVVKTFARRLTRVASAGTHPNLDVAFQTFLVAKDQRRHQLRTTMTRICISIILLLLGRCVESNYFVASSSQAHRPDAAKGSANVSDELSSTLSVAGGAAKKYMSARKMETLQ